ncbi:hypothetical protein C1Y63_09595 [Corynebacterium sp. 13CS0277]|uniref:metallopeptidase family protein n=1 Tax=Corynebacterium sp. 13CS0277 TaxID=2071994 RepID=UPI000D03FD4D|nr:metallopeptidase family protein [Corynebacterium sp. 13CS0277]PRQ10790.1 hypothetical protein C1Y63_09595 [Corynebacterium sp. 13CS0277]
MHTRAFRNRHGRGQRGIVMPQSIPRFQSRSDRFDALVTSAYAPLAHNFAEELAHMDIAVDVIPRMRLVASNTILPDEVCADGPVPLGRVIPAGVDAAGQPTRPRIVIFRRPIEARAATDEEREALIRRVLVSLVATYLNVAPQDIDPAFDLER